MQNEYYHEIQKLRQKWIVIIAVFPAILAIVVYFYGFYVQLIKGIPFGENSMSDTGLLLTGIFIIIISVLIPVLIFTANLDIRILNDSLYFRYFPFIRKYRKINFLNIASYNAIEYRPIRDFGGWGIRYSMKTKRICYNVSGHHGVEVTLNDGKVIVFGTQQPQQFVEALKKASGK